MRTLPSPPSPKATPGASPTLVSINNCLQKAKESAAASILGKQVERSIRDRHGYARHFLERRNTEITILAETRDHVPHQLFSRKERGFAGSLRERRGA